MNFLGPDLSLTGTGVYIIGDDSYAAEINTNPKMFPHSIQRVDFIADEIIKVIDKYNPTYILIENYFVGRNPKSVISLTELGIPLQH